MTDYYQWAGPSAWPSLGPTAVGAGCLRMRRSYGEALGPSGRCDADSGCPGLLDDFCGGDEGSWGETELEVWYALA